MNRTARLRALLHRMHTRRRFARVLRSYGYVPTRQLVDLAMDYEGDANPRIMIRESWRP